MSSHDVPKYFESTPSCRQKDRNMAAPKIRSATYCQCGTGRDGKAGTRSGRAAARALRQDGMVEGQAQPGTVGRIDDGLKFVQDCLVPGEDHMGQEFRLK